MTSHYTSFGGLPSYVSRRAPVCSEENRPAVISSKVGACGAPKPTVCSGIKRTTSVACGLATSVANPVVSKRTALHSVSTNVAPSLDSREQAKKPVVSSNKHCPIPLVKPKSVQHPATVNAKPTAIPVLHHAQHQLQIFPEPMVEESSRQPRKSKTYDDVAPMIVDSEEPAENFPTEPIIDLDCEPDEIFCSDYASEIFEFCKAQEVSEKIDSAYMLKQRTINPKMRGILVDWLAEVCVKFKLLSETLFLAVNIVDKYLSAREISRSQFQLLGVTALLIATKFEEIYSVEINDLVYISDNACTAAQIKLCERNILDVINFKLSTPSPLFFLRRYSRAAQSDTHIHCISKWLVEISLLDYNMLQYLPSQIAAASVLLARKLSNSQPLWTASSAFYSGYKMQDVLPCARALNAVVRSQEQAGNLASIKRKYLAEKLHEVAKLNAVTDF